MTDTTSLIDEKTAEAERQGREDAEAAFKKVRPLLSPAPKKTMTLNLAEREMDVLEELCQEKGMSKTAVMRQALRLYQFIEDRIAQGQRMYWKDKDGKEVVEMVFSPFGFGWEGMD